MENSAKAGHILPYPFSDAVIFNKNNRGAFACEKKMTPKSQILNQAKMELEMAEWLFRVCCNQLNRQGFSVVENKVTAPTLSVEAERQLQWLLTDPEIKRALEETIPYQRYITDKNLYPKRCAKDIILLMKELAEIRRELYFQYQGLQIGQDGEDSTIHYLEQIAEANDYILCENVILNKQISGHKAQTSEMDTCVITERGIILCEIKNKYRKGAKKITISKAGRWEEFDMKTKDLYVPAESPIEQNNTHDRDLRKFLRNHGYEYVSTIPVIVIANTNVEVLNYSQNKVIYISELDNIFRNNRNPVCLSREQMEDIARLLREESEAVEERAFPLATVTGIAGTFKETITQYLHDYEQECRWAEHNTRAILQMAQNTAAQLHRERELKQERDRQEQERKQREKREKRKKGIAFLLRAACIVAILAALFSQLAGYFEDKARLRQYTNDGSCVFLNVFEDTVVLTTWPIDKFEGKRATEDWQEISATGRFWYGDYDSENYRVVIRDDIYPVSTESWFRGSDETAPLNIEGMDKLHMDKVRNASGMFAGRILGENIDFSQWNMSSVEDISYMFSDCGTLRQIDLSGWDMPNLINAEGIFAACGQLESVDLSHWNMPAAENLSNMFNGCANLLSVDVAGWNMDSVTSTELMFAGCEKLESIDVADWNMSNVTSTVSMFYGCYRLQNIDVSGWDMSGVTDTSFMFYECKNLQTLDLSNWNPAKLRSVGSTFGNCGSLTSVGNINHWDISHAANVEYMFVGCDKLETLPNWDKP